MNNNKKRFAIISTQIGLDTMPSFLGLVKYLSRQGYGIDIYGVKDDIFPPLLFENVDINIITLQDNFHRKQLAWRFQFFVVWLPFLIRACKKQKYSFLIGIEPWGLILTALTAFFIKLPFVYFSLELYFMDELKTPFLKVMKLLERWFSQRAKFTIIQDWNRAELLIKENGLYKSDIEILPNAPLGEAKLERNNLFHDKFNIPSSIPIVLFLGRIGAWTYGIDLAR